MIPIKYDLKANKDSITVVGHLGDRKVPMVLSKAKLIQIAKRVFRNGK